MHGDRYTAQGRKHAGSVAAAWQQHQQDIEATRRALAAAWGYSDATSTSTNPTTPTSRRNHHARTTDHDRQPP